MTISMFFPDENETDRKQKQRAIKLRRELEQKGRAINLGVPKENLAQNYKVLEQSTEHIVMDLQQPKKKEPTVKEFKEVSGL